MRAVLTLEDVTDDFLEAFKDLAQKTNVKYKVDTNAIPALDKAINRV